MLMEIYAANCTGMPTRFHIYMEIRLLQEQLMHEYYIGN